MGPSSLSRWSALTSKFCAINVFVLLFSPWRWQKSALLQILSSISFVAHTRILFFLVQHKEPPAVDGRFQGLKNVALRSFCFSVKSFCITDDICTLSLSSCVPQWRTCRDAAQQKTEKSSCESNDPSWTYFAGCVWIETFGPWSLPRQKLTRLPTEPLCELFTSLDSLEGESSCSVDETSFPPPAWFFFLSAQSRGKSHIDARRPSVTRPVVL